MTKKIKRRTIEPKPPVTKSPQQKIRELQNMFAWLDAEEDRLLAESKEVS